MNTLKVYHGSYCEVEKPSLDMGRIDADFGLGFYVTPDFEMAEKWACRKKNPLINEYTLCLDELKSYSLELDEEWLDFVIQNRNESSTDFSPLQYDLIIGATADDKLFATIEQYESGFIDAETAVEALNCMKVGTQICVRTDKGLNNLRFNRSIELSSERISEVRENNKADRKMANRLTSDIVRNHNKKISLADVKKKSVVSQREDAEQAQR